MSFTAIAAAMRVIATNPTDLTAGDRLALVVLADAADAAGIVRLGSAVLAARLGMNTPSGPGNARRRRAHLIDRGYLVADDRPRSGHTRAYRLPVIGTPEISTGRVMVTRPDDAGARHGDARARHGDARFQVLSQVDSQRAELLDDDPPDAPTMPASASASGFDVRAWAERQRGRLG